MSLRQFGFDPSEVFEAHAWADGRLGVHATLQGEKALLQISTAVRLDLSLTGAYIHRRGLPVVRENEAFGVCRLTEFHALGRSRPYDTATFFGDPVPDYTSIYAGSIGVEYFSDAVLSLDAAGPAVGLSARGEVRESCTQAVCRIPLVDQIHHRLPLTTAIEDGHAPGCRPAFLFSTGDPYSCIFVPYIREHWNRRRLRRSAERACKRDKTVEVPLGLPSGRVIPLEMRVGSQLPEYVVDLGVERIDGILGMDFLRRWMMLFDFPRSELALFEY